MKIVLAALNAKYVHSNLAVYDLEAYATEQMRKTSGMGLDSDCTSEGILKDGVRQPEIVIREYTINHNLDQILQALYREKAAVVAFSCYIWNVQEILTIAKELKKVSPNLRIWLGGPEAGNNGDNILRDNPFIEGVMVGEGEGTFYELTTVWQSLACEDGEETLREIRLEEKAVNDNLLEEKNGKHTDAYKNVLGILYRDKDGKIIHNPARPLMNLDDLPFIYKDLSVFQNKILYYETSRGCPFSCSYCLSSIDRKVRFRSFSLVQKELDFFMDNMVPQVKLIDRTFNCNKEHALAIWRYIAEHDNGVTNFHFEVAADLIGEEELAVFETMRPGLIQLEIGLQSTNLETIHEIRRVMDVEKVKSTLLKIRSFGNIHQHLDLIAGLPYEDLSSFKKSFNDAYAMRPNQLQLGFLKVLKGSYMGEQVDAYELKYRDVQPYEVLSTKWISYDDILILKRVEEMVEVYYNSDQFEHVLPYVISFFETPYAFYETLGNYYESHQLFGIGFKREARYEALRDFCIGHFDLQQFSVQILDSLLTYDYYLRENAKSRPAWSKEEPIDKTVYQTFFKNGGNAKIDLRKEGYDSKTAARMMHIEPIARGALRWVTDDTYGKEQPISGETDHTDAAGCHRDGEQADDIVYALFDYEDRNPLSKDAKVTVLSGL